MNLIKPPQLHFSLDYSDATELFKQFLDNSLLLKHLYLDFDNDVVNHLSEYIIASYDSCRSFMKYKFSFVVIDKKSKKKNILYYVYKDHYINQLFELYKYTYTGKGKLYNFQDCFKLHFDKGYWDYSYHSEDINRFSNFKLGNQILDWLDSTNSLCRLIKLKLKSREELESKGKIYSEHYEDIPELEVCYGYINGCEFVFTDEKPLNDYKDSYITKTHIVYNDFGTIHHKLEANKIVSFKHFKRLINKSNGNTN